MRKIYCDRCKKLIKNYPDNFYNTEGFKYFGEIREIYPPENDDEPFGKRYSNYFDLCDKCQGELNELAETFMDVKKK